MRAKMLRVYLDNDVSSAISRRDLPQSEMLALDQLLEWGRDRRIVLGTSRQSHREMERAPAQYQPQLKSGLTGLDIASDDHKLLGFSTSRFFVGPLITDIVDEHLHASLREAGLRGDDANHFMYAAHNGFERFVTVDGDFLARADVLASLRPSVGVCKPSELVSELAGSPTS
jgi:predicted nucleic acid-binding protein